MPKRPQTYHRPQNLDEALRLLAAPDAAPLAGGTVLLAGDIEPDTVVDLQDLGLAGIQPSGDTVIVGAMTRLQTLHDADLSGAPAELLRTVTKAAGPNTFRNAATLGGLIASREPDSALLAFLIALDVSLVFADESTQTVSDYLSADERPAGLITEIHIPFGAGSGAAEWVGRTPADKPIVSVAGWKNAAGQIRLAASGISPQPIFLGESAHADAVTHAGDFRGSTQYRAAMLEVLAKRVLAEIG